ncbi:MAG: DUF1614 domain-containing protein [Archaeoglobaceae archaeon]|nr:DUF1614 domain-containing protein [Archaeoglobaceae archaeon]MDW8117456.1 DUF1614 domain-containing protein [Archaeoglobaceae archaeon]
MRDYIFPPLILPLFLILIFVPFLILVFVFTGSAVFRLLFGVDSDKSLLLIGMIVFGSLINIPLYERKGIELIQRYEVFGFIYSIRTKKKLVVAINIGGCVIPIILSMKLLLDIYDLISPLFLMGAFLLSSIIIYGFAKPVVGVGIVIPMLIPPVIATIASYTAIILSDAPIILLPKLSFLLGVLSTVFGADILHLREMERIGYGVISIGGAGTFDGIFLTGIFAVLFSVLLI